jgi:2-polyprenyl-6-methoxyphenol hydroxylase-like FAD-dependent oxidoreductase
MSYDIIIVGGRPAGASLAARLGARGIKVLVVDRATFPSLPSVPSSPIVHSGTMRLLDELGIDESAYADEGARMRGLRMNMAGHFVVDMKVPRMTGGRDYIYGIERTTFDDLLWRNLSRFPTVERREGFQVTDLIREGDRVVGIEGGPKDEPAQRITARAVVGADGRFSMVARRVGAEVVEEDAEHTSTVYYADWEDVGKVHNEYPIVYIYTTARGLDLLFFAMPNGKCSVNTHARSDRVDIDGDPERYYLETLRSEPSVWQYLETAKRVSPVVGIKKIGNGYRRASGPGWVLTGDAYHYKDPVDGQGIYDALLETKILDSTLAAFCSGSRSWEDAMAVYEEDARNATHPMFVTTVGRLKRELYEEPPVPVIKTMIRWTLTDPGYQETFLRVLGRDWPPSILTSKQTMGAAMARGIKRDVVGLFGARLGLGR